MKKVVIFDDGTLYTPRTLPNRYAIGKIVNASQTYDIEVKPIMLQDNDDPTSTLIGDTIPIYPPWMDYITRINTPAGNKYAKSVGMEWCNRRYEGDDFGPPWLDKDGTPLPKNMKAENISSAGNFFRIIGENKTHWLVDCFDHRIPTAQFNPRALNFWNYPYLFWMPSATDRQGNMKRITSGIDCFIPLLKGRNKLWVPKTYVETFPEAPFTVTQADGTQVKIIDYLLYGTSVFGILENLEKIYLLKATKPDERIFPTSWKLVTHGVVPPIRPSA